MKSTDKGCYIKDFSRGMELWKNMSPVRKSVKLSSIHLSCLNVFSKKKSKGTRIEFELFLASETLKGKKIKICSFIS